MGTFSMTESVNRAKFRSSGKLPPGIALLRGKKRWSHALSGPLGHTSAMILLSEAPRSGDSGLCDNINKNWRFKTLRPAGSRGRHSISLKFPIFADQCSLLPPLRWFCGFWRGHLASSNWGKSFPFWRNPNNGFISPLKNPFRNRLVSCSRQPFRLPALFRSLLPPFGFGRTVQ